MSNPTELLRRALWFWDNPESDRFGTEAAKVFDEIRAHITTEKEAEPDGRIFGRIVRDIEGRVYVETQFGGEIDLSNHLGVDLFAKPEPELNLSCKSVQKRLVKQWGYEWEPARKPITPKDRLNSYIELEETIGPDAHLMSFLSGIAAAERYHGISQDTPSLNDAISADRQDSGP
jgi:hypothetical protein